MAIEKASSSRAAAAGRGGGERSHGVANANLRSGREQEQEGAPARNGVANANLRAGRAQEQEAPARGGGRAPVQQQERQMQDWVYCLPEATRANVHLLVIWPDLEVEKDETPAE